MVSADWHGRTDKTPTNEVTQITSETPIMVEANYKQKWFGYGGSFPHKAQFEGMMEGQWRRGRRPQRRWRDDIKEFMTEQPKPILI